MSGHYTGPVHRWGSRYSMTLKRYAKSGAWKDRIRLPEDVRREYQALYGPAWEEKFHRPCDTPWDKAVAEHAAWAAKVKGRIAALRASKVGKGVDLTQREACALAGDWYRLYTSQHSDNPGSAMRWSSLRETLWDKAETAGDPETGEADFDDPEVLSGVDIEARASQFLTDRGIALTQAGRAMFLSAVVREFLTATETLERYARGDRSRDQHLDQLEPPPNLSPPASPSPNGQHREAVTGGRTGRTQLSSVVEIFEASGKGRGIKPSTIIGQRCVFTALDKEDWRAPEWDAQQWLDSLVTDDRSPQTVRKWLATARAVFTWAIRKRAKDAKGHRLVETNPFKDCFIKVPKRPKLRETDKAFTEEEIQTILRASTAIGDRPKKPLDAARRWVPWLCAYTGARGGEMTQLRTQDIEQRACGTVLHITPEAGTTKTNNARWVPIHPHLGEMGFLDYVASVKARLGKDGPLFYRTRTRPAQNSNGRGPATRARENLAKWVRELGITDPGVQPLHGWRHTFKTRAMWVKIEERIRDEICGQVPRGVAGQYEHPTVEDMAEALKRFPRYEMK
jgi:integrase